MASTGSLSSQPFRPTLLTHPPKSIKALAELPGLTSIPPAYTFTQDSPCQAVSDSEETLPIIDFSLLFGTPGERSNVIRDLGKACQEWGFFVVINHGIPESLTKDMIDACMEFFNLSEEEKLKFEGKNLLDPIKCGTSFNTSVDEVFFWRDFLKVFLHPEFHSLTKPANFSELSWQYSKKTREVARELLKGIAESLGLEPGYIEKALNVDASGFQILVANLYPPCPQPELAIGMPAHSDFGLLTLLTQNGIGGLQILRKGNWVNVDPVPNSFLVNIGDHLEIVSNGKYKSVLHRAVVNSTTTRLSLGTAHGPSLDAVVSPAPELIARDGQPPAYMGIKYKAYIELQQRNQLDGKSALDRVRIQDGH